MKHILFLLVFLTWLGTNAQTKIDSLFTAISLQRDDSAKMTLFIELANEYIKSNPDSARIYYEKAVSLFRSDNPLREAKVYYQLGQIYGKKGLFEKSLEWLNRGISLLEKLTINTTEKSNIKLLGEFYFLTAKVLSSKADNNKAIEFYRAAGDTFNKVGEKNLASRCYNNAGVIFYSSSQYDSSLVYYNKALKLREEIQDTNAISNSLLNIAVVHMDRGRSIDAINILQKALELKISIKDTLGIAHCYNNLGNLNAELKNYSQAVEYYTKALVLRKEQRDNEGIAASLNNIGTAHYDNKDYTQALKFFQEALEIALKVDDPVLIAHCYANLGNTYKYLGDLKSALFYLEKCRAIREKGSDMIDLANVLTNLSDLYYELAVQTNPYNREYLSKALTMAEKSYSLIKNSGYLNLEKITTNVLMKIYKHRKDWYKAFLMAERGVFIRDSLYEKDKMQHFIELEQKFQLDLSKQQIINQQLTIEKQQIELKSVAAREKSYINGSILLAIFLLSVIVMSRYIFINYKRQKEYAHSQMILNKEIVEKNNMIENKRKELENLNQSIINNIEKVRHAKQLLVPAISPQFESIANTFSFSVTDRMVENDFIFQFETQNHRFIVLFDSHDFELAGLLLSITGYFILREIALTNKDLPLNLFMDEFKATFNKVLSLKNGDITMDYDISAIMIPKSNHHLYLCTTGFPIFIVRHGEDIEEPSVLPYEPEVSEEKVQSSEKNYNIKQVPIFEGDQLYLFSASVIHSLGYYQHPDTFNSFMAELSKKSLDNQKTMIVQRLTKQKDFMEYIGLGIKIPLS